MTTVAVSGDCVAAETDTHGDRDRRTRRQGQTHTETETDRHTDLKPNVHASMRWVNTADLRMTHGQTAEGVKGEALT